MIIYTPILLEGASTFPRWFQWFNRDGESNKTLSTYPVSLTLITIHKKVYRFFSIALEPIHSIIRTTPWESLLREARRYQYIYILNVYFYPTIQSRAMNHHLSRQHTLLKQRGMLSCIDRCSRRWQEKLVMDFLLLHVISKYIWGAFQSSESVRQHENRENTRIWFYLLALRAYIYIYIYIYAMDDRLTT
jgi:hypothetical protein